MDLIIAVQANDVSRLRQVLANRKAAQTSSKDPSDNSYYSLQMACEFAARYNHPAALEFLLNEIDEGESFKQLLDHYQKLIVCQN